MPLMHESRVVLLMLLPHSCFVDLQNNADKLTFEIFVYKIHLGETGAR